MHYDLLIKNGFLVDGSGLLGYHGDLGVAGGSDGGASRLIARADGYRYTVVNGQVLLRDGEPTGACPGRVLRSYEQ